MLDYSKLDSYLLQHLDKSIAELSRLVAQPSISAQNIGLIECAQLVGEMLSRRGFNVEIIPTVGAPVVFAERKGISDKTLLIYNHYDVQPPEPLELWVTPPFSPTLRDGKLFGRGSSDDKGHIVSRFFALDAILNTDRELPCNVKFIIEGEEETSSVHLHEFIEKNQELLHADACIWEFGGVDHQDRPNLHLGLRGICYVELSIETADSDVHSGLGGSIFPNPAWRLVWALNSLKGSDGRVRIPGFYECVKPPTTRDIEYLTALPEVAEEYQTHYGVKYFLDGLTGGPELRIKQVFEPTCTICGLTSGYQGPGSKTVLPARASAKIDFRLVPDQDPFTILDLLKKHLQSGGFSDIKIDFLGGEPPARTDPDDPFVKLVVSTASTVYDQPMQLTPMIGGSGPNYPFVHLLKLPVVTAGAGYPGSQSHAPNENIRLDLYLKHAQHMVRILKEFGKG